METAQDDNEFIIRILGANEQAKFRLGAMIKHLSELYDFKWKVERTK